jgi:hypothetical protein
VRIANRVGRPAVLEINIFVAVDIPDKITLRPVDHNLTRRAETASCRLRGLIIEKQAILKDRNAALHNGARFGSRNLLRLFVAHSLLPPTGIIQCAHGEKTLPT